MAGEKRFQRDAAAVASRDCVSEAYSFPVVYPDHVLSRFCTLRDSQGRILCTVSCLACRGMIIQSDLNLGTNKQMARATDTCTTVHT